MNRKKVKVFILCFSFMLFSLGAYSEIPLPPPQNIPPGPGLPIDGGLSLLLASGVIYGIYSLKRKK